MKLSCTKFYTHALLVILPLATLTSHAIGATSTVSRDKLGEVIEILDSNPSLPVATTGEEISTEEMLAINRPALQPITQTSAQPTTTPVVANDAKLALPKLSSLPLIGKIAKPTQTITFTTQTVATTTGINRLRIGMSNYEVMSDAVMGKPKKITRNLTKEGLSEVWEYNDNITLTFVNNTLEKVTQAQVLP